MYCNIHRQYTSNTSIAIYTGNVAAGTPTDCPTREKHGWLGDAQVTAEEAMQNFDMVSVYEEFLVSPTSTKAYCLHDTCKLMLTSVIFAEHDPGHTASR